MTKRHAKLFVLAAVFLLCGCDVWPTKIENNSSHAVTMRYWHSDYDRWSPDIAFTANRITQLRFGHHLGDVRCIEIIEGARRFRYEGASLRDVHALCRKTRACTLHYLGGGKLRVAAGRGFTFGQSSDPAEKRCPT